MTQYLMLGIYANKYEINFFYSMIEGRAANIFAIKFSLISVFFQ